MSQAHIRFDDGKGYEQFMGKWSRPAGEVFLDWLAPAHGLSWIDVGCGNGAFTELLVERCQPLAVHGIDPSEGQLSFARQRPVLAKATFAIGDAGSLAAADNSFDAAVMALVIIFTSDPAKVRTFFAGFVSEVVADGRELTVTYIPERVLSGQGSNTVHSAGMWLPDLGSNQGPAD